VSVVANVAINVDATAAERALKNLGGATDALQRKFDTLPGKLSAGLQGLGGKISAFGQQLTGLGSVMAGIGASAAVGGFVKAGIEADRTAKTIKALAGQYGETAKLTEFANSAASKFGIGQTQAAKAVADLYGRLRPMGISLGDIQKTFTGVNNAAAKMNLTAADTDGVMLQLSQAMGSGALQGDELRSVMERLPAVGQAIAKTMGVPVSQIKQLGSEGKLTTDIIVKAMDELAKMAPPPPDAFKLFQAALADLNTTIGTQLLPIFTPLVQKLGEVVAKFKELGVAATIAQALKPIGETLLVLLNTFIALPAPVQGLIVQVGVLAGAFALIAAPLGFVITGIGSFLSAIGAVIPLVTGFGATIAGWAGAIGPVVAALGTLGKILLGVFTGPVGWVALAVAAGAAIYAFRDQIGQAFRAIGGILRQAAAGFKSMFVAPVVQGFTAVIQFVTVNFVAPLLNTISSLAQSIGAQFSKTFETIKQIFQQGAVSFKSVFIDPVIQGFTAVVQFVNTSFVQPINSAITGLVQSISSIFKNVTQAITAPFQAAFNTVRGIINQILNGIGNAVRGVVSAINNVIAGANSALAQLNLPQIQYLPTPSIPQFAEGGVVTKPTLGLIGEAGTEYIVPESKAADFATNYLSSARGASSGPTSASISIQTGPVMEMNGTQYVTTQDMSRAVQAGVQQTLAMLRNDIGTRRAVGIA
jgi:tape measure domain-containing protein